MIGRGRRLRGGRAAGREGPRRSRPSAAAMLLSLVLHMYSLRSVLPAAVMLGSAPTYLLAWGAWRLLSACLPSRVYQAVDDRLYCVYQSMVLFFFENYTGVQVSSARRAQERYSRPAARPGARAAGSSPRRGRFGGLPSGSHCGVWPGRPRGHQEAVAPPSRRWDPPSPSPLLFPHPSWCTAKGVRMNVEVGR